jgi:hypothetical protein
MKLKLGTGAGEFCPRTGSGVFQEIVYVDIRGEKREIS